jgi:HK97 family phage prohead protease
MLKVRGYAAIFGNVDAENEVLVKGAFSDWIDANPSTRVKIYWMHAHKFSPLAKPVGVTTLIRQDAKGLYFEGEILDTVEGLDLQVLLRGKAIKEASFGFDPVVEGYERDGIVYITSADLKEITAANWGCNSKAYIEAIPEEITDADQDQHRQTA